MTQIGGVNPNGRNAPSAARSTQKSAPKVQASYAEALRAGQAKATESHVQKTDNFRSTGSVSGTTKAGAAINTENMTMDEYKSYIHSRLSQIPRHPSQAMDTVSINISEAGFEAMKNDPEYEKWVFDSLAKDFAVNNPWTSVAGGCYCVHNIGATKEECNGQSWYAGYQNGKGKDLYNDKSKNSFWEKRAERHKESLQRSAELAHERRMAELASGEMTKWGSGESGFGSTRQATLHTGI